MLQLASPSFGWVHEGSELGSRPTEIKVSDHTLSGRSEKTSSVRIGAVIQSLRAAGHDPIFFDIDGLRPPFEDVVARFRSEAPDVVGISAVVSTAYGYVKKLCLALREALPRTRIVLGGNLAASAEILHRRCGIDVCVIGEGEQPMVNLIDYYRRYPNEHDHADLERIKGQLQAEHAEYYARPGRGKELIVQAEHRYFTNLAREKRLRDTMNKLSRDTKSPD